MNLEKIIRRLLIKYPLFGSVVANANFLPDQTIKTAATDGKKIYYNPNFMNLLTDAEQTFVFAHEVCHIAFNHIFRSEGKDKTIWNKATDAIINAYLKEDGLSLVKGCVDIEEAINYDAEEMYQKLLKEKEERKKQGKGQGNGNSNQDSSIEREEVENENVGHDDHSIWEKAIEKKKQKEKSEEKRINEEIKKLTEIGEKQVFAQNKIERKKRLDELSKSLASQAHGYGTDTEGKKRSIIEIGYAKPLIDWRILLKEAIKYEIDWSYQNAQIEDGVLTPYLEEIPKPEVEILLDTSGSIKETLLRNFLRECKNILQNARVKVGCFDTAFYGFNEVKDIKDIDCLPFYGGGGTDFEVAVNAFSKRVENKIIFTDGISAMPTTPIDAIWVVFGNQKINPPGGRVIYIDSNDLNNLYNYISFETKGKIR